MTRAKRKKNSYHKNQHENKLIQPKISAKRLERKKNTESVKKKYEFFFLQEFQNHKWKKESQFRCSEMEMKMAVWTSEIGRKRQTETLSQITFRRHLLSQKLKKKNISKLWYTFKRAFYIRMKQRKTIGPFTVICGD